ncbi:MAG TPA: HEAT repeat domain-containing protein [Gemmataceae bacterium]|jgi:hypothetical protein
MICYRLRALWLVPLVLLPFAAGSSSAGIIFGKKNKKAPTPAERVPQLLAQVKTDGDESKRAAAAEELRQYDPAQFPTIVPILIDVLLTDKKPAVRAEAAQSLGKIRPIAPQAGQALEQALTKDSSMRVRLQARSSLLQYHWSGYRGNKKDEMVTQTKEPPLADPNTPAPVLNTAAPPPATGRTAPQLPDGSRNTSSYPNTPASFPPPARPSVKEPPLAPATPPPPATANPPAPLPPMPAPAPAPAPTPGGNESGPDLTPP